jgi:hypothetical protein
MIRRSWKSILAGIAMVGGMTAANTAFAYDGCGSAGCGDCQQCEQIFADAGQKLTDQLAGMSCCGNGCCEQQSCCAPASVCDPGCSAPCGDILGDACGESCGEGCGEGSEGCGLFGESGSGIKFGGWVQAGYHSGLEPLSVAKNDGLSFNDRPDELNLHQGWLYAERIADGSKGFDWGFRADVMYGTDATSTQAFGNNPGRFDFQNGWDHGAGYGFALPQVYGEVAAGDWSVKIGHFFTLVGYEVVTAPGNFFYSHALTMYNSEPFTHTGALATYKASDEVQLYGGWTAGWDTGFDRRDGGSSFLGGAAAQVAEDVKVTYIATAGNFGWRGDGYSHSIVVDTTLTDKLNYVLQSDVVRADVFDTVGVNNYLFYTINDQLKAGTRAEWWKADGASFYAVTYGVNITPMENVVVRPEVRHDWSPGNATDSDTFGIDAIFSF